MSDTSPLIRRRVSVPEEERELANIVIVDVRRNVDPSVLVERVDTRMTYSQGAFWPSQQLSSFAHFAIG